MMVDLAVHRLVLVRHPMAIRTAALMEVDLVRRLMAIRMVVEGHLPILLVRGGV